jgi:3-dehydroquinate dehydratase I
MGYVNMHEISIGTCSLGRIPRLTAIVDDVLSSSVIKKSVDDGADILEMRVDCFSQSIDEVCDYISYIRKTYGIPIIGTIRENERTRGNRLKMFSRVIPLVDAVDIEIDADIAGDVIKMASDITVIVSEHDFGSTPSGEELNAIVKRAMELGGNIVKIAAMAQNREDVIRLFQFIRSCSVPVVAFSMGEYGAISRVMSMLFGSLYSYGYITEPNAPGQLSIGRLAEATRFYYPEINSNLR